MCLRFKKNSPKTFGPHYIKQQNAGRDLKTLQCTDTKKRYKTCHLRQNVLYTYTHLKGIIQIEAAHSVVVCDVGKKKYLGWKLVNLFVGVLLGGTV
jgi:hypothetical protein